MKIGILTFPKMTSYGCSLQMYAMYRAVEKLGAEAEIINYRNEYMKARRHTSAGRSRIRIKAALRVAATKTLHLRQILAFRRFEAQMSQYPPHVTTDKTALAEAAKRYDGVICGSDQVWNPLITDTDLSFFLDFCGSDTKRIAYAPSFGISEFSEEFTAKIRPELEKFSHLSVRETAGVRYVKELVDRPVETVLDPTFLIDSAEWESLEQAHPLASGKYMFCFPVRNSDALVKCARALAEKRGLTLIVAQGNYRKMLCNKDRNVKYAPDLTPGEWLYLLHHADTVVTNSFHGAAFSIHYRKNFYLEGTYHNANSRLDQLMELCGLQDRVLRPDCSESVDPIDFDAVEARLAPARASSRNYLKQAIEQ